jgi:hypothetical protein
VAITAFPRALRDRDRLDGTLAALQHASCFALGLILTERLLLGRSAAHSVAKTRTFAVRRNRQANPGIENRLTYGSSTRTRTRPRALFRAVFSGRTGDANIGRPGPTDPSEQKPPPQVVSGSLLRACFRALAPFANRAALWRQTSRISDAKTSRGLWAKRCERRPAGTNRRCRLVSI